MMTTHSNALMAVTITMIGTAAPPARLPAVSRHLHRAAEVASRLFGSRTMTTTGTAQKLSASGPTPTLTSRIGTGSSRPAKP